MQSLACKGRLQSLPLQSVVQGTSSRPFAAVRHDRQLGQHIQRSAEAAALLQTQQANRQLVKRSAGPVDAMPTWTLDQIAGLAFGGLMLAFYFGAQYVDVYVAKQQRRELGLCESCGGVYDSATCKQDKCPLKEKAQ